MQHSDDAETLKEAKEHLERAVEKDGDNAEAHFYLIGMSKQMMINKMLLLKPIKLQLKIEIFFSNSTDKSF